MKDDSRQQSPALASVKADEQKKIRRRGREGVPSVGSASRYALFVVVAVMALFISSSATATAQTAEATHEWVCPVNLGTSTSLHQMDVYGSARTSYRGGAYNGGGWHLGMGLAVLNSQDNMISGSDAPVVAVETGNLKIFTRQSGLWGWQAVLHADSGNSYEYAHFADMALLSEEDKENIGSERRPVFREVKAGSVIGNVGSSGGAASAETPRLYFTFRKGSVRNFVNPKPYIDRYC